MKPPPDTEGQGPEKAGDASPAALQPKIAPGSGLPQVVLKANEDRRVRRGHLWVFSNEVANAPANIDPGTAAHFMTARGGLLGTGFYHPRSLIAGRLLDRGDVHPDAAFFERRFRAALDLRSKLFNDDAYRLVHGESDDLPGLAVDRYGEVAVVESYCAGMDRYLEPLLAGLKAVHPWTAVVVKNDAGLRRLEGLETRVEVVSGELVRPHWFTVDGVKVAADLLEGQKTGFFFDQRMNRRAAAGLAKGRRVLDVFCHTGGFGMAAAAAGAASVAGVDSSEPALALARAAAEANGFAARMTFQKADAFDFLNACQDTFDVVVVDPPKFAPSKKDLAKAEEAYIRLNALAMRRVTGGGFLATSSCSQHMERELFRQVLSRAAHQAGRRARIILSAGAGPDHPVRPSMPETDYLKFSLVHIS